MSLDMGAASSSRRLLDREWAGPEERRTACIVEERCVGIQDPEES
jgi:hypothetical protein